MKKVHRSFVCQECGQDHIRWSGRCDACGAWSTLVEETVVPAKNPGRRRQEDSRAPKPRRLSEVAPEDSARMSTGIAELDRVLGGGMVPGSAILVGGDPGVGKSTLLLAIAANRAGGGFRPLYVTAEESAGQIALRAGRIASSHDNLMVMAEDRIESILDAVLDDPPDLLVVDSIQTVRKADLASAAGSVAQVRESSADLIAAARSASVPLFLVGHVTKDGMIAGPKVLEHLVDVVLYFEGERDSSLRILRSIKNRYGPTGEVAVFAMGERGLTEPSHPGALFLGAAAGLPGTAVAAAVEGSRVFLVEVQALTAPATYGPPRIRANGVDPGRAAMLAAVLNRRAGLPLGDQDIHVNVAGGFRLSDPGCDLAICLAMASSFLDRPAPVSSVAFGEIGLGGEIRTVRNAGGRLREARALGFGRALTPIGEGDGDAALEGPQQRIAMRSIGELIEVLRGRG